jgi:hypothetical protein
MSYTLSPVGLAAAPIINQVSFLATFKEKLCRPFCVDSTIQPQVTLTYTLGTNRLVDSTVFVPVTAVITVVTPNSSGCDSSIKLYTETFNIAFQGRTSLPATTTIKSMGRVMGGSCIKCGRAHSYTINDSLIVTISTATTASEEPASAETTE